MKNVKSREFAAVESVPDIVLALSTDSIILTTPEGSLLKELPLARPIEGCVLSQWEKERNLSNIKLLMMAHDDIKLKGDIPVEMNDSIQEFLKEELGE